MNPNAIRQYLQLADEREYGGKAWSDSASSYNPNGLRLNWATEMVQRDREPAPNFFAPGEAGGYSPAPYTPPQRFEPQEIPSIARQAGFPMASGGGLGEPQDAAGWQQLARERHPGFTMGGGGEGPSIQNYLRTLLQRGR